MNKTEILSKIEKINYITQPSSVVLVSTVDADGVRNLAPIAQMMVASSRPPILTLGISPKSDTYKNIVATGEFVVGIPAPEFLKQLLKAGDKVAPEVDEFEYAGFTPYASEKVAPAKIAECPINIECKLNWLKETGNHFVICGDVLAADADSDLLQYAGDNTAIRTKIPNVYHVGNRSTFGIGFKEIVDIAKK